MFDGWVIGFVIIVIQGDESCEKFIVNMQTNMCVVCMGVCGNLKFSWWLNAIKPPWAIICIWWLNHCFENHIWYCNHRNDDNRDHFQKVGIFSFQLPDVACSPRGLFKYARIWRCRCQSCPFDGNISMWRILYTINCKRLRSPSSYRMDINV